MLVGTVQDYMHDFTCISMSHAFSHIRMVRGFHIDFYCKDVYDYQKKINKILAPFVTPYLKSHLQTRIGISDVFVIDDYTLPNTDGKKISLLHFDDQLVHPGPYTKYRLDHEQGDDDTHFRRCSTLFIVDTTIDKVIETESCVLCVVVLCQHYNVDTCKISSKAHMSVGSFGETNTFCKDILLQVLQHADIQDIDTLKISLRV